HDQDEQPEREDGQWQRENKNHGPDERVDEAQHKRGHYQCTSACERDARKQLIGDPESQGGDQESKEEASHGWEDNRCARPVTKRAVMPGRACTPSLESISMVPLMESRPEGASDRPANGPRSAGQPLTMASSASPHQLRAPAFPR